MSPPYDVSCGVGGPLLAERAVQIRLLPLHHAEIASEVLHRPPTNREATGTDDHASFSIGCPCFFPNIQERRHLPPSLSLHKVARTTQAVVQSHLTHTFSNRISIRTPSSMQVQVQRPRRPQEPPDILTPDCRSQGTVRPS